MVKELSYNERLFIKGIRSRIHKARYYWLEKVIRLYSPGYSSVFELGCYDCKSLDYLPSFPNSYLGVDANWENGLEIARKRFGSMDGFSFIESDNPSDIPSHNKFDISICMETLEHINEDSLPSYIEKLFNVTDKYLYVTIPNEMGLVVFVKYMYKLLKREDSEYSLREMLLASLGHLDNIKRTQHKGFDYRKLISQLSNHFEIVKVTRIPFPLFPFTIGVVCKKR